MFFSVLESGERARITPATEKLDSGGFLRQRTKLTNKINKAELFALWVPEKTTTLNHSNKAMEKYNTITYTYILIYTLFI